MLVITWELREMSENIRLWAKHPLQKRCWMLVVWVISQYWSTNAMFWFLMHLKTGLFYSHSSSECFCLPWEGIFLPTKPAIKISFCAQFCQKFLVWERHQDPVQADVSTGSRLYHMKSEATVFIRAWIRYNTVITDEINVKMKCSTSVCLSSSLCSKTCMPSFPCCAARKAKNRCHFTRMPENRICERRGNASCVF